MRPGLFRTGLRWRVTGPPSQIRPRVKKIYLGEDTPTQALFIRGILSREEGLEPVVFGDGLNMYLANQKEPPDLIISDNVMPTLDGLAIARLVKFHEETSHVPFLLVSSMSAQQIGDLANSGVDCFLPKPLKIPLLKEAVARLLGGPSAEAEPLEVQSLED